MTIQLPIGEFSPEQRGLWARVVDLWAFSKERDEDRIRSTLHPRYVGWDMREPAPHGRDAAVRSVVGDSPELREYQLRPLSVQVYDGQVGVVHYCYTALIAPKGEPPMTVTGRWSEVYLKQSGAWIMLSVSGRPDEARRADCAASA